MRQGLKSSLETSAILGRREYIVVRVLENVNLDGIDLIIIG
jgi:hypothetical protein